MTKESDGSDQANGLAIDIWYGRKQSFGQLGNPQKWINVMGRVSPVEAVASIGYSLNDGPERALSVGADIYRLLSAGDFNADIGIDELKDGENTVRIRAVDKAGVEVVETVTVDYTPGKTWPVEYEIDWAKVSNVQDVAQVVDGWWGVEDGVIRPVGDLGYDRLVALGDMSWTDYEITVGMTIHEFDFSGEWPPAVGLLVRWTGHNEDSKQPRVQWWPLGALCWYLWRKQEDGSFKAGMKIQSYKMEATADDDSGLQLELNVPYFLKARVESGASGGPGVYSMKIWPQDVDEPADWLLQGQGHPKSLGTGCVLLLAHHTDVSFGKVVVKGI